MGCSQSSKSLTGIKEPKDLDKINAQAQKGKENAKNNLLMMAEPTEIDAAWAAELEGEGHDNSFKSKTEQKVANKLKCKLSMNDLIEKKAERHEPGEIIDHEIAGWEKHEVELFQEDPVHSGDQFMACKPWKGAVKKPTIGPGSDIDTDAQQNSTIPDMKFEFDFVHGYKSDETYQNCLYNANGQPVYMTACLGIVLDTVNRTQNIFGGGEELPKKDVKGTGKANKPSNVGRKQDTKGRFGHPDDIRSLWVSKNKQTVATGSNGREPFIFTWNAITAEKGALICLPRGTRSVSAIAMCCLEQYIYAADMSDDFAVHIFDTHQLDKKTGRALYVGLGKSDRKRINSILVLPGSKNFMTAGVKCHLKSWNIAATIKAKDSCPKGISQAHFFSNLTQTAPEGAPGNIFASCSDGNIYTLGPAGGVVGTPTKMHTKPIYACKVVQGGTGDMLLTGSFDRTIKISTITGSKLATVTTIQTGSGDMAIPRSLDFMNGKLLVGMANGTIGEFTLDAQFQPQGLMTKHIEGHYDGEAWGIAMVQDEGKEMYITCGDDNTLLLHDILLKKVIGRGTVDIKGKGQTKPKPKFIRGGASTMSKHHASQQARGITYQVDLNHLAIGTNEGLVSIRTLNLTEHNGPNGAVNMDNELCELVTGHISQPKIAKEWIEELVYSPDAATLAVGSHDNRIYLYHTNANAPYTLKARCDGHSSYITTIDFTADNSMIRTTCGAYELLFFSNADTGGKGQKNIGGGASATVANVWENNHAKFGWRVDGIYPEGTDGTYVNSVELSKDETTIATGTDNGVALYRNPCRNTEHQSRMYRGHSEFVCRVRLAGEQSTHMISIGGQDQTCIQWKRSNKPDVFE